MQITTFMQIEKYLIITVFVRKLMSYTVLNVSHIKQK